MNHTVDAVKNHKSWITNKEFFERQLSEYRANYNGEKDDCIIIFADKRTGNFNYSSNTAEGNNLTPFEIAGILEVVKHATISDAYNA
jgi:hypothetical protein